MSTIFRYIVEIKQTTDRPGLLKTSRTLHFYALLALPKAKQRHTKVYSVYLGVQDSRWTLCKLQCF